MSSIYPWILGFSWEGGFQWQCTAVWKMTHMQLGMTWMQGVPVMPRHAWNNINHPCISSFGRRPRTTSEMTGQPRNDQTLFEFKWWNHVFYLFFSPCIQWDDDMSILVPVPCNYSYALKKTQALLVLGHPNPKTSSAGRWTTSTCCGHHGSFIVRKGEGRPPQKKTQGPKFKNKKCQFGNWLYLYTYNYILMLFVLKLDIHVKRPLVLASVHKKPTKNVVDFSGRFGHKITSPVAPSNNKYVLKCFSKLILYWRKSVL